MKYVLIALFFVPLVLYASNDSLDIPPIQWTGDFRFRLEPDWHSRKSDGTFRDDRSRLRFRARVGMTYTYNKFVKFGIRIRTGNPRKQQDPQITLGDGFKEFGTIPIGMEKLFLQANYKGFIMWAGKNTFPYRKNNELFWSDNVYPEGVYLGKQFEFTSKYINSLQINIGHYIVAAGGGRFNTDAFFQGFQVETAHWDERIRLFPSFYLFRNLPDIPDGREQFLLNYAILHFGTSIQIFRQPNAVLEFDLYHNVQDLQQYDSIPVNLQNEKTGFVVAASIGELKKKKDWQFKVTYTYLQRFAAVDFLAQNDWARWDYSNFDSPDGRLTNFQGLEIMAGYAINKKLTLKTRYFLVDQLIAYGFTKETNSRIRFDIDIAF